VSCGAECSVVKVAVNIMGLLDVRSNWAGEQISGDKGGVTVCVNIDWSC